MVYVSRNRMLFSSEAGGIIGTLLFLLFCAAVIFAVPQYTLGLLSAALVVDDEPAQVDAIVILLNPGSPARTIKAAELYAEGLAPRIVLAGGEDLRSQLDFVPPGFSWPRSSDANVQGLQSLDIPTSSIVVVDSPEAYDTAHELTAVAKRCRSEGWSRVILVTSASHTRRARMIWRRVAPRIDEYTVAAPQPGFDHWWSSGRGRKAVMYEYGAIVKELCRKVADFFGSVVETAHERQARQDLSE